MYYRINSILVYQISGSDEAGYFAAAQKLVDQVQIVPIAIVGALFPLISEAAKTNPERLRRFVASGWEILVGLALPIVTIVIAVAHPLAGLLFGEEFRGPTGTVLMLVWPVVIAIFLGYLAGALVPAINLVKVWTIIVFAGAAFSVGHQPDPDPALRGRRGRGRDRRDRVPGDDGDALVAIRRADLRLPMRRVTLMLGGRRRDGRRAGPARHGLPVRRARRRAARLPGPPARAAGGRGPGRWSGPCAARASGESLG